MAVFLLLSKEGAVYQPPPATGLFADVPVSSPYARWIEELARRNVTSGCGGANYCPNSPTTRAQMAVLLLRTKHGSSWVPPPATGIFADVPVSNPFARWIEELYQQGISAGCGGGNFCPNSSVTRGQMAVFLVTAFQLT
jgi:hypothetical protein